MLYHCSERIGIDINKDAITKFIISPFISKRFIVLDNRKEECFVIHDSIKNAITITDSDYKKYCSILISFYNNRITDSFYRKIFKYDLLKCQIKTDYFSDWINEYNYNELHNNLSECNTLIKMLLNESDYNIKEMQWRDYYIIYNKYINRIDKTDKLINKSKIILRKGYNENNIDIFFYVMFLLINLLVENEEYKLSKIYLQKVATELNKLSDPKKHSIYYLCLLVDSMFIYIKTNENKKLYSIINELEQVLKSEDYSNNQLILDAQKAVGIAYQHQYKYDKALSVFTNIIIRQNVSCKHLNTPIYLKDSFSIYDRIGELLIKQAKYDEAIHYYLLSIKKQQTNIGSISFAWSKYNLGRAYYLQGNLDLSEKHLKESILIFERNNSNSKAYPYGELSYVYQYRGEVEKSIESLKKSIFILFDSNEIEDGVFYFNHLGRLYQSQGFLRLAKKIFELCIFYILLTEEKKNIGWIYNNYARNYLFENNTKKAMNYLSVANRYFKKENDLLGKIYIENNVGEVLLKLGNFDDAYINLTSSLEKKKAIEDQHAICYTYREISEYFLKTNDIEKAKANIELANNICQCCNFGMLAGDIYLTKGKIKNKEGDIKKAKEIYTEAYNYYEKQNFITRMIYCLRLKNDVADKAKEKLINSLQICLLQLKLNKEEEYLTNQISPIFIRLLREIEKMRNE